MAVQIKHEAEVTRQHARFRIPARMRVGEHEFTLREWSVSGFSADAVPAGVADAKQREGTLSFDMGTFALSTDLEFEVIRYDPDSGTLAGRFVNVSKQALSLLHYIINAYLAGELVTAGDVLHVAGRDDFVKKDFDKRLEQPQGMGSRLTRAVKRTVGYALLLALFAGLLWFIGYTLYDRMFVVEALSARVQGPIVVLRAPDDGVFDVAEEVDGGEVSKGQLLGIVRLVGGGAASIESPCNCRFVRGYSLDGAFVGQGEPLVTLLQGDGGLRVEAQVAFAEVQDIRIGHPAEVQFPDGSRFRGVVRAVHASSRVEDRQAAPLKSIGKQPSQYATAVIETGRPIPVAMLDSVAAVRINTFRDPVGDGEADPQP